MSRSRALYWAAVLALLLGSIALRAPALRAEPFADDWDHYAIEQGLYPVALPAWDMFDWVGGQASQREALLRAGRLPWWASHDLQLSVLRPLASLLAHVDYAWLDGVHHPLRMHLHSLGFWLWLELGIAALFARLLPRPVALLGVAMCALDDALIMPFFWIANRSALIALGCVVWALYFHVASQTRLRWPVVLLVLLGLAAGEHALAPLAYLAAASLFGQGPRLRRLWPLAGLVALYVGVRAALGYGIAGSGFYVDPLAEPGRYLQACATRIPVLLGELVFSVHSEWWHHGLPGELVERLRGVVPLAALTTGLRASMVAVGVLAGLVSLAGIWALGRRRERQEARALQWLLCGALVSLVPLAGTIVLSRLTLVPALAFNAALAYLLWISSAAVLAPRALWRRCAHAVAAALIVAIALVVPAQRSRAGSYFMSGRANYERHWVETADYGVSDLTGHHVFVLSARDFASQFSIPYILHAAGRAMPTTASLLSPVWKEPQLLTRVDERSFELLYPLLSTGMPPVSGSVYRAESDPMRADDVIASELFEVRVLGTQGAQPGRLRFEFRSSLDDPALVFMVAGEHQLTRFTMPAPGERVVIAPAGGP